MVLTDRIKRYGINGRSYPVGPLTLVGPNSGDTPSDLARLGGFFGSCDRWEVSGEEGLAAGDYTIRVGPYSEAGLTALHRSLGDVSVIRQSAGMMDPLAPLTCLGRSRPRDSRSAVELGPFSVLAGDRLWVLVEWRDQSSLRYQIDINRVIYESAEGVAALEASLEGDLTTFVVESSGWVREMYDGEYTDAGYYEGYINASTAVDSEGFYYIGGGYQDEVLDSPRAMLKKYDEAGAIEWVRYYDLTDLIPMPENQLTTEYYDQIIQFLHPRPSGGLYAVFDINYFRSYQSGPFVYSGYARYTVVAEMDSSGDIVNQESFWRAGSSADDSHYLLAVDSAIASDGKIILLCAGKDGSENVTLVIKLNADLSINWEKKVTYGDRVAVDGSGNIFIAAGGYLTLDGVGVAVTKLDSTGAFVWQSGYVPTSESLALHPSLLFLTRLRVDGLGNVYVGANVYGNPGYAYSTNLRFGCVLKLNPSGAYVWDRFDDPADIPEGYNAIASELYDIRFDTDNNVYVMSQVDAGTAGPFSIFFSFNTENVLKFSPSGTLQWGQYVFRADNFEDTGYYDFFVNGYSNGNVLQVSPSSGVLMVLGSYRFSYEEGADSEFGSSIVAHGSSDGFAVAGAYGEYDVGDLDALRYSAATFAASTPDPVTVTTPTSATNTEPADILDLTSVKAYTSALTPLS